MSWRILDVCSEDSFQSTEGCSLPLLNHWLSLGLWVLGIIVKGQQLWVWGYWWVRTITQSGSKVNSTSVMIFWGHLSMVWKGQQLSFCWLLKLSYSWGQLKKKFKELKSLGRKGIRELRGLFSYVNYDSTSARRSGNSRERALIVSQWIWRFYPRMWEAWMRRKSSFRYVIYHVLGGLISFVCERRN